MTTNKIPNISFTLRNDLCTGCGVCEDACPAGAITTVVEAGRFVPQVDAGLCNNGKGCHRCMDACPGVGIDLCRIAKGLYDGEGTKEDRLVGRYLKCFVGHSTDHDIRYHSASGGMVSQFLVFLLEKGLIDGAVVTAFDPGNELLVSSYIAHNREEVLRAKGSKYAPVSLHGMARAVKADGGSRYVVVGLPCHIEGFRKLEHIDRKLREKVVGYFAVYCSSGRTFHLTEHVFRERGIDKGRLTYFAYRDEGCLGSMVAKQRRNIRVTGSNSEISICDKDEVYKEKYQSYYHPLRSFFIPRRCLFCIDHYGELADVCFGDIHVDPYISDKVGVNSLVVRDRRWLDLLLQAKGEGCITLDEISAQTLNSSQRMAYKKKGRNGEFVNLCRRLGLAVPRYDADYLRRPTLKAAIGYAQNRAQQFAGRHKSLWWIVSLLKKDTSKLK